MATMRVSDGRAGNGITTPISSTSTTSLIDCDGAGAEKIPAFWCLLSGGEIRDSMADPEGGRSLAAGNTTSQCADCPTCVLFLGIGVCSDVVGVLFPAPPARAMFAKAPTSPRPDSCRQPWETVPAGDSVGLGGSPLGWGV